MNYEIQIREINYIGIKNIYCKGKLKNKIEVFEIRILLSFIYFEKIYIFEKKIGNNNVIFKLWIYIMNIVQESWC